MDKETYNKIIKKYGHCSSWAIWENVGKTSKSNIGNNKIFDLKSNPDILKILKPNIIFVGLNISRKIENIFGNFHDGRPSSQDYKIRYAFKNSIYFGAYMTDIIKDFEQVISGNVMQYLKMNKSFEDKNIALFEQELLDLKSKNPVIIAFGNDAFTILDRHFKNRYRIFKIPHYSIHISKENYKNEIELLLKNFDKQGLSLLKKVKQH